MTRRGARLAPSRLAPSTLAPRSGRLAFAWPVAGLFLLVLTTRVLTLLAHPSAVDAEGRLFDGLYGQDAFAYYQYATGPLLQSLRELQPFPDFFWPPGYPFLLALLSLLTGPTPLAGQLLSMVSAALVAVFTALLAAELLRGHSRGPAIALGAGLLAALHGQLWQSSIVVMADATALAAATGGAWALVRYGHNGQPRWLGLAAAAVAFAVFTRWAYALVAIPCTLYALYHILRLPPRRAAGHLLAGLVPALMLLAPLLGPALQALLAPASGETPFAGDLRVYSWHPLNALQRQFFTADGLLSYRLPNGLYYALAPGHPAFFGPLAALFLLPGVWVLLAALVGRWDGPDGCDGSDEPDDQRVGWASGRRPRTSDLLLIGGWVLVVYGFHAGAAWQNFRFTLAYLPPLAIMAAVGMAAVWRRARGRWRLSLAAVLALALVYMAYGGWALSASFITRKHADLETVRWVQQHVEAVGAQGLRPEQGLRPAPEPRLLAFGLTATLQHYSTVETHDLFYFTPAALAELLADGRPALVLVDVPNVTTQWRDRPPGQAFTWLAAGPGLQVLGQHRNYTLFNVPLLSEVEGTAVEVGGSP